MSAADLTSPEIEAYLRHRTGWPASAARKSWLQRIQRSKWTWTTLLYLAGATGAIWLLIADVMRDREAEDGSITPGLNADALWLCAGRALPTMAFWAE